MLKVTTGRTPGAISGGTLVTTRNHATGAVETAGAASIQLVTVNAWVPFELSWSVTGQQTSEQVVLPATADVEWSANGATGAGANTALNVGVIGNAAVRVWVRALTTRALGNLTQVVSNVVYGYGVDAPSAPEISGFSVSGVSSSAATINGTLSDPDTGDTVTGKLIVRTTNTAPTSGEWAGTGASGDIVHRAAYTGPSAQVTGLSNSTTYYVFLRAIDSTSLTDIETGNFTTSAVSNVAPTISTLTTDQQTSQGFRLAGTFSDPEGDTITAKRYIVCTTNSTPNQAEIDGGVAGRVVAVGNYTTAQVIAGLTQSTNYYWWLYATDATHPNLAAGATLTAAQSAATGALSMGAVTATPTSGSAIGLDWADVSGASGYDVEYGTTTSYGSSITDPTSSSASITGLSGHTLYYVRVRAYDSAGNVSGWETGSATTMTYFNDFTAGQSIDTTNIGNAVGGSGTVAVSSNRLVLTAAADADGAAWYDKATVPKETLSIEIKVRATAVADATHTFPLILSDKSANPAPGHSVNDGINADLRCAARLSRVGSAYNISFIYNNTSDVYVGWDSSANSWVTTAVGNTVSLNTDYIIVLEVTSTQFRFILKSASGTEIETTAWVNWTSAKAVSNALRAWGGEIYTNGYNATLSYAHLKRS